MSNLINTFVAGYTTVETIDKKDRKSTSIALLIADKVGKNPMIKVKASKRGSLWLDKGFTLEEVKKEYPYGTPVTGYEWGDEVQSQYGGIYKLVAADVAVEEEKEEGQ